VPDERIVMTAKMLLNGKPTLVQLLTIEFVGSGKGTDLILTNQGTFLKWGRPGDDRGWVACTARSAAKLPGAVRGPR